MKTRPCLGPQLGRPGLKPLGMIEQRHDLPVPVFPPFSLSLPIQRRAALGGAGFPLSGLPWPAADGAGRLRGAYHARTYGLWRDLGRRKG